MDWASHLNLEEPETAGTAARPPYNLTRCLLEGDLHPVKHMKSLMEPIAWWTLSPRRRWLGTQLLVINTIHQWGW